MLPDALVPLDGRQVRISAEHGELRDNWHKINHAERRKSMKKLLAASFAAVNSFATFWQPTGVTLLKWVDLCLAKVLKSLGVGYNNVWYHKLVGFVDMHQGVIFVCQILFVFVVGFIIINYAIRTSARNKVDCKLLIPFDGIDPKSILGKLIACSRFYRTGDFAGVVNCKELEKPISENAFLEIVSAQNSFARLVMGPESKCGYILPECMFVPVDADGNTIVVRRCKAYHSSLMSRLENWMKDLTSFISVSPVPLKYGQQEVDLYECYHQKIPRKTEEPVFKHVGVYYHEELSAAGNKGYLMSVYLAYYKNIHLCYKESGETNWTAVRELFARSGLEKKWVCWNRYFNIDHDSIVCARKVCDIIKDIVLLERSGGNSWLKVEQLAMSAVRGGVDRVIGHA